MAAELKELTRTPGGGELVGLSKGPDGVEKVDIPCVEKNCELVRACWELQQWILSTYRLEELFRTLDRDFDHALSGGTSKASSRAWARYEAEKSHAVLSYTARLCRRASHSKSVKVTQLKKLWREHHSGDDPLQAGASV